jgi:hypothetical protein
MKQVVIRIAAILLFAVAMSHGAGAASFPSFLQRFFWSQSNPAPIQMMNTSQGICGLYAVGGRLRGGGEFIRVEVVNGFWQLSGASQQAGVNGAAWCAPFSQFITPQGTLNFTVGAFHAAWTGGPQKEIFLWGPDSKCWLNGVGGNFGLRDPGASDVKVHFNYGPNNGWLLTLAFNGQYLEGGASCLSVPGQPFPKALSNQHAAQWDASQRNAYYIDALAHATESFCYLVDVSGYFDQNDEIQIRWNSKNNWFYMSGTQNEGQAMRGQASCIAYNQTLPASSYWGYIE